MKIAASKAGMDVCQAARCPQPPAGVAVGLGDEGNVKLCPKHLKEAEPHAESVILAAEGWPGPRQAAPQDPAQEAAALARTKADEFAELAEGFEITCQEDLELASELIREAKGTWDKIEAERKKITAPLDAAKRAVQALFKPPLDSLAGTEAAIKHAVACWSEGETARNRALAAAGESTALTSMREVEGLSTRKVRTYTITDPEQVPRELCSPDPAKIREFMASLTDEEFAAATEIPGVTFSTGTQVVSR